MGTHWVLKFLLLLPLTYFAFANITIYFVQALNLGHVVLLLELHMHHRDTAFSNWIFYI